MYSPRFSELAVVSVRRLAWALNTDMGEAVDVMAQFLSQNFDSKKICALCQDNSKCHCCGFGSCGKLPENTNKLLINKHPPLVRGNKPLRRNQNENN
jgi:hypothetical protein